MRRVHYRADRLSRPLTVLPVRSLVPEDGWSDDPADPLYNRLVRLPHRPSHERLWREDRLYDIVVELGYNDSPPLSGRGSAIFLHLARPDWGPTQGCVALALEDLLAVLAGCSSESAVDVGAG
jgi:L,D-peptidoglycan transpeptidase YkuD (ErfK/YbiS/YcfS/YnhG family)